MSRIESGRMVLEESWVNLRELIEEVTDLMKPEIMAHRHEYTFQVADTVPEYVLCDKLRMTQLLLNLLSNAVKYTPRQGRVKLEVSEGAGAPTGYTTLAFVVSDTGIGISREFQKKLFEPFERENNTTVSKVMGSGLGMPICKGIVDSMGGSMTVDSMQGRGTVITVHLAMRCKECDKQEETTSVTALLRDNTENAISIPAKTAVFTHKRTRGAHKKSGPRRLLVVEDNELNREIAKELLEDDGYLVETAEDGETSVVMIARSDKEYYDAILMDIQMPGIDGYEAARSIRRLYDKEHAEIPIIAMTANAFDEDMEKARSAGMDGYIAKPVDPESLKTILGMILPV
jgi:CheY-like chemotaxis protein/anti-sigma regulatory factor (Ser/Thr protein kinase)